MRQPPNTKQSYPSSDKTKILIIVLLLAILLVVLGILLGIIFRQSGFQFSMPSIQAQSTPITSKSLVIAPTLFIPTPDCGMPTLVIGATTFQIQPISPAADSTLTVPPDTAGIAYWVNGMNTNYIFVLSPTSDNISLISTLVPGSTVKATWNNCNSTSYTLFALEQNPMSVSSLLDQLTEGITIFLPSDPSTANYIIRGELTEEQISIINTPDTSGSEIQAEISLLETTASPDGTTVRIGISIQNYGSSAFTLTVNDVTLITTDSVSIPMLNSEPALPKEIAAGSTEMLYFTFQTPSSPTALFSILGIEYEVGGY